MQGTVVALKRNGVIVQMDSNDQLEMGDLFEIYRVENGVETVVGSGYIRKPRGTGMWKLNPMDADNGSRGQPFTDVREGDLVRPVTT